MLQLCVRIFDRRKAISFDGCNISEFGNYPVGWNFFIKWFKVNKPCLEDSLRLLL